MFDRFVSKPLWILAATIATQTLCASLAQAVPSVTCAYDPNSGKLNPLGMRAFVQVEESDGNTTFRYEQFPSIVGSQPQATIAQRRELTLYKTNLTAARQLLLKDPKYYQELVGYADSQGFKPVNDVLVCRPRPATKPINAPRKTDSRLNQEKTLADYPNGEYRFWSGKPTSMNMSDDELLKQGGALFVFNKQGNRISGSFGLIDNTGVCIQGTAIGNLVTGTVSADKGALTANQANQFFDPAGFLKLGRWQQSGNRGQFQESTLNLATFNRINLGSKVPKTCS